MSKNTYLSAKTAALSALSDAATFDAELVTAVEKASSPKHTATLRELCNKRLQLHSKVSAAVRYLDQCANRPAVDPIRAAILRGDVEVIRAALLNEVFEVVSDSNDADCELLRLLEAIWPAWCKKHNVDDVERPVDALTPETPSRVRAEWLPVVNGLWGSIVDELVDDLESTRKLLAKLAPLAATQNNGRAGIVEDALGRRYYYRPDELEAQISRLEKFIRSASRRAAEAK